MITTVIAGDLVNLFMYSPHDSELAHTPLHTGIFIDYDYIAMEHAWLILVEGEINSYSKMWWNIKKAC